MPPTRLCLLLPLSIAASILLGLMQDARAFQSGATTRVSVMTGCNVSPVNLGNSSQCDISDNGQFVAFMSNNSSLGQGTSVVAWFANLDGEGHFGPMQLVTSDVSGPSGFDVGLLDADDRPDVMTAALVGDRIDWFSNELDGDGGFAGPLAIGLGMDNATTAVGGDLDGDGDVDVLGTASELLLSAWWPNDGRGGFGPRADITPYGGGDVLVPADMDGDGDQDVLLCRLEGSGVVGWQENVDGAGHFTSEHLITGTADGPRAVVSADFDGDGDRDVVLASDGAPAGPRLVLWRNTDGQGAFGSPTLLSTAGDLRAIDTGDVDGDGDQDVMAAVASSSQLVWFRNNGTGGFTPALVVASSVASPSSIRAVDLDGDGDRDCLMTSAGNGEVAWYRNANGVGGFGSKQLIGSSLFLPQQTQAADLDGDGDPDVLAVEGNSVEWYRNTNGLGAFGPKLLITNTLASAVTIDAADMDGDGDRDVLAASEFDDQLVWYPNLDGLGSFGTAIVVSTADMVAHSVVGRDMDADGDTDIVAYRPSQNLSTWYENVDGLGTAFDQHDLTQPGTGGGRCATTADIDGDGDPDVLVAGGVLGDCSWFENPDGLGHFGQFHVISTSVVDPRCAYAADVDGDGDLDALSASFGDSKLAWYRNLDGQGHFGPQLVISTAAVFADWVTTGDLNGDGKLDVLGAGAASDNVLWFESLDGAGSFGSPHLVAASTDFPRQVVVGDVDGDSDADVLTVSSNDDEVSWHENTDGLGLSFTRHVLYDGPGIGAVAGRLADMDGDGDLDAVFASSAPGPSGFEIFVHDRLSLDTHWVTATLDGDGSPDAQFPTLSGDGRYVAFESKGPHVPGDSFPGLSEIYVHELESGTTVRASVSSAGVQANDISVEASLSGDGRYVAFSSYANNLVAGDPTCCSSLDVFLRDQLAGTTVLANPKPDGGWPNGGSQPALSADGQFLAFLGGAEQVTGDTNPMDGIFVRDLVAGVTERASLASGDVQITDAPCGHASISADGRFVAFETTSQVDAADTNAWPDVYVHDRMTGTTSYASSTSTGGAANSDCQHSRLSADGGFVVFLSAATNLAPGFTSNQSRAYRRDLQTGELTVMSVATDGTPAAAAVGPIADISGDGQLVAFSTAASGLVPSDTDTFSDVFVHGEDPWFPLGCDTPGAGGAPLLYGSGPMEAGSGGVLTLASAKPLSFSMLFVSVASNPTPFKGGILVALPPVFQVPLFTGPGGGFSLHFTWPSGIPAGLPLFFHQAILDPAAPQGVALSTSVKSVSQ